MTKPPTVSVLMPVYNTDQYVAEAVESILAQTFDDFEFIIIDDGSTDGSLKILEAYAAKDKRIRLTSRPNTGHTYALNEMLRQAKGDFIARIDSDDVAMPDRFARQVEFLQREPDVVCLSGAYKLIDEKGRLLTRHEIPQHNDEIQRLLLAGHTSILHTGAMMRRASVIQVGGYNPTMEQAQDIDLFLKLGEVGELANLKDIVAKYRLHTNSVSAKKLVKQNQTAQEACKQAWQRRGIQGRFEATEPWRPGPDRFSQHRFMLKYGWWAFNSGQRQTAISYGTRAIAALPFALDGWKLLACAAFKQLPNGNIS